MYKNFFFLKKKKMSIKFFFDGKSYKLSIKPKVMNFRFNRVNKTILLKNNLNIKSPNLKKKLYIYNLFTKKSISKINFILKNIRKYNTYTIRGLYSTNTIINKRVGRVSEYV